MNKALFHINGLPVEVALRREIASIARQEGAGRVRSREGGAERGG
jgi:hypothetical protein